MSSLLITIDADPDIVMSGSNDAPTDLGVTGYQEPAVLSSVLYGAGSPYLHGATALAFKYEQSMLNFTVGTFGAASEAEARALVAELRAAVSRMGFNVTVNVDGAGDEVWLCDPGSVTPVGPRSWVDIRTHITEWNVSIPCYPVAS